MGGEKLTQLMDAHISELHSETKYIGHTFRNNPVPRFIAIISSVEMHFR